MGKCLSKGTKFQIFRIRYAEKALEVESKSVSDSVFCDPMDDIPPDSSVHGVLQARILEWVAILFPRGSF